MASGLTKSTPCCPKCGKSTTLRVDSEEKIQICLRCGYKCDVITGKPLTEYKTKDGKEIDRLEAENANLKKEKVACARLGIVTSSRKPS